MRVGGVRSGRPIWSIRILSIIQEESWWVPPTRRLPEVEAGWGRSWDNYSARGQHTWRTTMPVATGLAPPTRSLRILRITIQPIRGLAPPTRRPPQVEVGWG